jgi:hypothetical protein
MVHSAPKEEPTDKSSGLNNFPRAKGVVTCISCMVKFTSGLGLGPGPYSTQHYNHFTLTLSFEL